MDNYRIEYYDEVTSTNEVVKEIGVDKTVVVAGFQSAGKGRLGRRWQTPKGEAIAMSIYLTPNIKPINASMLTLVAALAVSKVLGDDVKIKWPNDLVISGKKLVGILTEMSVSDGKIRYVVIGIGINVNVKEFPEELKDTATSLWLERKEELEHKPIIEQICKEFSRYYDEFVITENMSNLLKEYNSKLVNCNRRVKVIGPDKSLEGVALGINEQGELLVRLDDGRVMPVISGEVSVRGMYGYV